MLNYDIVLPGLGWFSLSGKGLLNLEVYINENINPYLRDDPIMPYEIKSKGVKKYFGNTINSKSKINRKYTMERYKNTEKSQQEKNVEKPVVNKSLKNNKL